MKAKKRGERHANPGTRQAFYRLSRPAVLAIAAMLTDAATALADEPKPTAAPTEKPNPATYAEYLAPRPQVIKTDRVWAPDAGMPADAGAGADAGAAKKRK